MQYLLLINVFIYIYSSVYRRNIKRRFFFIGLIQDHHIIPREFRYKINYENTKIISHIDHSNNLLMMPTRLGKQFINTNRTIHENGHNKYNRYINKLLDSNYTPDYIIPYVKQQLRKGEVDILI